jgi:hypothetical protein
VALGIDGVLLDGDRELEKELREVLRNSAHVRGGRGCGGGIGHESALRT